jgi:phospholipase/lecithinase/hemolysin
VFQDILDNPIAYSFERYDPSKAHGGIWVDGLHPTEEVHDIVAEEFERFLSGEGDIEE